MSAFYELSGSLRLRKCDEIEPLLDCVREQLGDGMEEIGAFDGDIVALSVSGRGFFAAGGVNDLDDAILALGPYAVAPAVFTFNYDFGQDEGFFGVGPSDDAVAAAESRHALEDVILPAVGFLTDEDARRLIARLVGRVE